MRKLILNMMISLDGFIDGPNGEMDFGPFDEETQRDSNEFLSKIGGIVMGRVAYQKVSGGVSMENFVQLFGSSPEVVEFVKHVTEIPKYVISNSLVKVEGARVIKGDVAGEIRKMKREPGKDLMFQGGPNLVALLMQQDLLDEIRLGIVPVVLGGGKPLFKGVNERLRLKLVESRTLKSGLIQATYVPTPKARPSSRG